MDFYNPITGAREGTVPPRDEKLIDALVEWAAETLRTTGTLPERVVVTAAGHQISLVCLKERGMRVTGVDREAGTITMETE